MKIYYNLVGFFSIKNFMFATAGIFLLKLLGAIIVFLIFNAIGLWLTSRRRGKIYNAVLENQNLVEYNGNLLDIFSSSLKYIFGFIGIYVGCLVIGWKLSMLLGLVTLAVSSIFKQIFADLAALFSISFSRIYKIGDWVEFEERAIFDEDEGEYTYIADEPIKVLGKISDLTRRYVRIKNIQNQHILIPNSVFTKGILKIYDQVFQFRPTMILGWDMRFDTLETEIKEYMKKSVLGKYVNIDEIKLTVDIRNPPTASIDVLMQIDRQKLEYAKINYLTYRAELEKAIYQVIVNQGVKYRLNYITI